jgi:hypothetical protein
LAFVVARPTVLTPVHVLAKGTVSVDVLCRRGNRVFTLEAGEPLQAGDEIRFRVRGAPAEARFVTVGSVDGTSRYSPFYPPELSDSSAAMVDSGAALPGGITIDDEPGPERVLVVLSASPLRAADVARVAEQRAAGEESVESIAGIAVHSSWLVLPKRVGER